MGLSKASDPRPHDETDPGLPATPMDQHDRYLLPDPSGQREGLVPFTRASTVKGRIQNSEALKVHNEIMLAKGLAISPDIQALIASTPLGVRGARDIIKDANEQAKIRAGARAAANLGSALHAFTEQVDKGEPLADVLERVPDTLKADVQAYADMLEREGLRPVPELIERIVINTKLRTGDTWDGKPGTRKDAAAGCAARFDRMYLWTDPADGRDYLVPGDLKTGRNAVEYGSLETCVQEAIAANADLLWNEDTETYEDMPGDSVHDGGTLRKDFGLLIHLPVGTGTCNAEELDLELGWRVAQLAVELMLVDKAKNYCHRPFSGKATRTVFVSPVDVHQERAEHEGTTRAEAKSRNLSEQQAPAHVPDTVLDDGPGKAADGTELAPLARDIGAKRGCGECGRVGHRKGSPKCLGAADPAKHGPEGPAPADEPATVPVPDGVIACGPDGAVTELTPGDAAVVEEFAQQLQTMAKRGKPCSHSEGYSRGWARWDEAGNFALAPAEPGEDAPWLCPDCGQESPQAAEARQARAAMNGTPAADAQAVLDERTPAIPDETRSTDEDQGDEDQGEPELTPERDLMAEIAECQDREDLQALRRSGMADGTWKPEHTKAGVARLRELSAG